MKNCLFLLALISLYGCGTASVESAGEGNPTEKTIAPNETIDASNAALVTSYENTPESVLMYFYASKIRQDNAWEKVCVPAEKRTPRFVHQLEEYTQWKFIKYRFVKKEEFRPNAYWATIYMVIDFNGDTDDGEDQATVELIDGKWLITEVPI